MTQSVTPMPDRSRLLFRFWYAPWGTTIIASAAYNGYWLLLLSALCYFLCARVGLFFGFGAWPLSARVAAVIVPVVAIICALRRNFLAEPHEGVVFIASFLAFAALTMIGGQDLQRHDHATASQ